MVIKGGARSGPGELALHLLRTDQNEHVHVRELRNVMARDLTLALMEMDAMGLASRSGRRLYHANIDWRRDEHMTEAQKTRAVDRLAAELGLSDQPRAVVEHVKGGREHLHVVWLRIDTETGRAISDSHNYRRHEIAARDLEREFGHERVQGAHIERDGRERPARTPDLSEIRAAERSGITPAEAKAELTRLWRSTDTGRAFMAAIEDSGWHLARGDKRDLVALDRSGEVHSLAKRIEGAKAKDVRERLADIDPATLPGVDQARKAIRDRRREAAERELQRQPECAAPAEPAPQIATEQLHQVDREREITPPILTPRPEREAAKPEQEKLVMEVAAQVSEATQRPSYEAAEPTPTREPVEIRLEPSRLAQIVTAARDRLASLAGRLEQAFTAVLHRHQDREPIQLPEPPKIQQPEKPAADLRPERQAHAAERDPWEDLMERGRKEREARPAEPRREAERDTGRSLWEDWSQGRERKPRGPGW